MTIGKRSSVQFFLIELSANAVQLGRLCTWQQSKRFKHDCAAHPKDFRRAPSASMRAGAPGLLKSHD
jgi:hypothetical protein